MKAHRTLATVTAALLVGPMLMAVAAQAAPAGEEKAWSPALLSTELYSGSSVRLRYTEGITVVASAGAKVIFKGPCPTATQDGRRVLRP